MQANRLVDSVRTAQALLDDAAEVVLEVTIGRDVLQVPIAAVTLRKLDNRIALTIQGGPNAVKGLFS